MKTPWLVPIIVAATASLAFAGADDKGDDKPAAAAPTDAAASLSEFRSVLGAADCRADAVADPVFIADAKNALRPVIHQEDSRATVSNNRHVVMAYAALLGLLVVFVLMLGMRIRKLVAEVDRLEEELSRAIEDEK